MIKYINNYLKNQSGATMVEYGLMVAVIAMIVVVGGISLGIAMDDTMDDATRCADAPSSSTCLLD